MYQRHLLCGLLLLFAVGRADAADLVTLDRGSGYELSWIGTPAALTVRVYVTRTPEGQRTPIGVTLTAIADGKRSGPDVIAPFQAAPSTLSASATSFDIVAPAGTAVRAGTYEATLVFVAGRNRQAVPIQLIVPAATVTIPASVRLERIVGFWGTQMDGRSARLHVLETGTRSAASVRFRQAEPFANDKGQYGATVTFPDTKVEPGGLAVVAPTVTGHLPVGVVASRFTVSGEQLAAPLSLAVQIATRRSYPTLLVIIAFGLGLGFLVRVVFTSSIELNEARANAFRAHDRLIDRSVDEIYKGQLAQARAALAAAIRAEGATKTSINEAITAADEAQKRSEASLRDRLAKAQEARDALARVVTPPWALPPQLADAVVAARAALQRTNQLLQDGNAKAAQDQVDAATLAFRTTAIPALATWTREAAATVDALNGLRLVIDRDRLGGYDAAVKGVAERLAKAAVSADADLPAIKVGLDLVDHTGGELQGLFERAAGEIEDTFAEMTDAFTGATFPAPAAWRHAADETMALVAAVRGAPDAPTTVAGLVRRARDVRAAWRDALLTPLEGDKDKRIARAADDFKNGDFVAAARAVAAHQRHPVADDQDDAAFRGRPQAIEDAPPARAPVSAPHRDSPAPEEQPAAPSLAPAESFEAFRSRTLAQLVRDRLLRFAVSSVGLAFIGYMIFADKWVGTNADVFAALMWGLTTDIGVDALVGAAKKAAS